MKNMSIIMQGDMDEDESQTKLKLIFECVYIWFEYTYVDIFIQKKNCLQVNIFDIC